MAHKVSTIILKVDLDCRRCYKKISETICKLQERENIQTIEFDEKNSTVTISGPFDPKKLCKKLCCKASNVIKDIQITEKKEKEELKNTKLAEQKNDKSKDQNKKDEHKKDETKDDKHKNDKSKENKKDEHKKDETEDDKHKTLVPVQHELGCQPVRPSFGCNCGCRPWYEGYYGKCCWCGRGYGCPPVIFGAQPCRGYETCPFAFAEEPQSSCTIM